MNNLKSFKENHKLGSFLIACFFIMVAIFIPFNWWIVWLPLSGIGLWFLPDLPD